MGASLPPKEANLFKLIVKSYETKQYKKGLKAADAILKKFPDHGETLSMKGLTLNCMDRKVEAYELVRCGLKNDLKSHVCWHVYGLLYRSDREYGEAIKCYRNALKIEQNNIEILRDLSLLQAQMRDLAGFVETRRQLLTLKPTVRINWIGFAVAQHLNSNGSNAIEILEAFERTLEDDYPPENERFEHGEMLLYKVDKLGYKEQQVSLLIKLGRVEEAEKIYRDLLSMIPDNYRLADTSFRYTFVLLRYYEGLQKCLGLYSENGEYKSEEVDQLDALYQSLSKQYNWSSAAKRIPLDFLQGERFREAADIYIRPLLTKGVPSLFSDLSPLYDLPGKADILEKLFLELENSIKTTGGFPGSALKEPPSTLMWTLNLLAQHYDRRVQHEFALAKIDEAIEHTPTVIDLYSVKGRILKHAGDLAAAAALADEARSMDLADRFINSECVKRMLQADQVGLAEKTAVLFTKDGDQHNNLHDMQCMWYELASGESYFRQGDLGRALKKFLAVEKHYADMTEDQLDFHSYCLRKMTLRAYVEMLKFQDQLHSHAYFHKAAAGAVRCYIKLYDSPPKSKTEDDDEISRLLPSQKKKLRQKQRKAEARAKKEAEEKNEETSTAGVSKTGKRQHTKPVDLDPHGDKLLQVEDLLAEGTKYLKLLQRNSSKSLETHLLSFEINMRKQKILLAFQAVKQLLKLDADNPDSHRCLTTGTYRADIFISILIHLPHWKAEAGDEFSLPGNTSPLVGNQMGFSLIRWRRLKARSEMIHLRKNIWRRVWAISPLLSPPFIPSTTPSYIEWLNLQAPESVLHILFGSQSSIDVSPMVEFAKGLEASGKQFIRVVRPPNGFDPYEEFSVEWMMEVFEDRIIERKQGILVKKWATQMEILSHESTSVFLSHCSWNLIRFFHRVSRFSAPANDSEKLVWSVIEVERPSLSQLHEKSLIEMNRSFLEKHTDSLMHRAAAAEMMYVLEPEKKLEAIKLIEESINRSISINGALGPVKQWKLKDCIAVHKLLVTVLVDPDAASRWRARCAEYFPFSTYFGGLRSSAISQSACQESLNAPENGGVNSQESKSGDTHSLNGNIEAFKAVTI
ncbi:Tetratricopeptide repeat-containing domain-containing protein [Cinnamomum micranthum f. kanehirae]|uniref:Tetratricopeptide repeat-containing domain-containing protein n=1 Tax=Cinnamomum micranthum f. kanehirae TaxID=337451 RepID=A0A443NG64_9MAGN|nr:Tetratricopeptide repeat-containing domain-containing protein [Cinnamomum micranthum f. kanehirae]